MELSIEHWVALGTMAPVWTLIAFTSWHVSSACASLRNWQPTLHVVHHDAKEPPPG